MSSPDKVDLLKDARRQGYRTYLYFVCTESPTISEGRVRARVLQGGHGVPAHKIVKRYGKSLALLKGAIAQSHRAYLYDNSGAELTFLAEFENAKLVRKISQLPDWFRRYAIED